MVIILAVIALGFYLKQFIIFNGNKEQIQEYTPQQEISEEQFRKTFVSLMFQDKQTGELKEENRLIDAKGLLTDPYKALIQMLINGPNVDNLSTIIPTGTKINKVELKGDVLDADFSEELTKGVSSAQKEQIIQSITDTVIKLNEINSVKITVNGNAI